MSVFDVKVVDCELWFVPITMRVPLKFGNEITSGFDTVKVRIKVEDSNG